MFRNFSPEIIKKVPDIIDILNSLVCVRCCLLSFVLSSIICVCCVLFCECLCVLLLCLCTSFNVLVLQSLYTDRHFQRIDRLLQKSFILDFTYVCVCLCVCVFCVGVFVWSLIVVCSVHSMKVVTPLEDNEV